MVDAVRPLGARAAWDLHVGGDHVVDALGVDKLVAWTRATFAALNSSMRAAVYEENGGHHDLSRALAHARINARLARYTDAFLTARHPSIRVQRR